MLYILEVIQNWKMINTAAPRKLAFWDWSKTQKVKKLFLCLLAVYSHSTPAFESKTIGILPTF
jgi:hypothetical protein